MQATPAATDATSDPGLSSNDIIIAVYGATGSGKSTLIEKLTGMTGLAGDGVGSVTSEFTPFRISRNGKSVVFVDTPGFDDTHKSDLEVLMMFAEWLKKTYSEHAFLSAILYIHPIANVRFSGSARKNLNIFTQICGKDALRKVLLLTTMWDLVPRDAAEKRELGLKRDFWSPMTGRGMRYARLRPSTPEHAWKTLDDFLVDSQARPSVILLQKELAQLGRRLNETAAAKELYKELRGLLRRQQQLVNDLGEGDGTVQSNAEISEARRKLQWALNQVNALKIPIHRRILGVSLTYPPQLKLTPVTNGFEVLHDPGMEAISILDSIHEDEVSVFAERASVTPDNVSYSTRDGSINSTHVVRTGDGKGAVLESIAIEVWPLDFPRASTPSSVRTRASPVDSIGAIVDYYLDSESERSSWSGAGFGTSYSRLQNSSTGS